MASNKSATHAVDTQRRELERLRADVVKLRQDNARMRFALTDAAVLVGYMKEIITQAAGDRSWLDRVLQHNAQRLLGTIARGLETDSERKDDDP